MPHAVANSDLISTVWVSFWNPAGVNRNAILTVDLKHILAKVARIVGIVQITGDRAAGDLRNDFFHILTPSFLIVTARLGPYQDKSLGPG